MGYERSATSVSEQVDILKQRNLVIEDECFAKKALQQIGYFRFKGYCLPYYKEKDVFQDDMTFERIYNNYRFDERIRLLLFQIIEHIEVEMRSVISSNFALSCGPIGHYNSDYFSKSEYHKKWFENFDRQVNQASKRRELYSQHYIKNYQNEFPVWVALEISDFGSLSKFYTNLENTIKNKIAKDPYKTKSVYLSNWIYVLSIVRNICAHNGRIYDKIFPIMAKWHGEFNEISQDRAFAAILICKKICLDTEYYDMFVSNLIKLVDLYNEFIDIKKLGFPCNWEDLLRS